MEENNSEPIHDKINCIFHKKGSFLEENAQIYSIDQNLCHTYVQILNLNAEISYSINKTNNNIMIDNLPYIIYGRNIIIKEDIPNFFKVLTGIDRDLNNADLETKLYFEMMEKSIFIDLQMLLNYYSYLINLEKTSMGVKIFKSFYSPIQSIISRYNDSKISMEISRIINVSTREECLFKIRKINSRIETYLASFGVDYYTNVNKRNINSLDFAIYAAYKTQMSIFESKIKKDELNVLKTFIKSFDEILLNKIKLKNKLWNLTSLEFEEYHPRSKRNLVENYLSVHREIINTDDPEKSILAYRKICITGIFLGIIFFAKHFLKSNYNDIYIFK